MESELSSTTAKIRIPWYLLLVFFLLIVILLVEGFLFFKYSNNGPTFTLGQNKYELKLDQKVARDVSDKLTFSQTGRNEFFVWDNLTWHKDIKKVEIEFVDAPQPYGVVVDGADTNRVLSSFNDKYVNGTILIKVQLADFIISQELSDPISVYTDAIMRALFFVKNPDFVTDKKYQDNLNTIISNQVKSDQPLLSYFKKTSFNVVDKLQNLARFLKIGGFSVGAAGCSGDYECGTTKSTTVKGCYDGDGVLIGSCTVCNTSCRTAGGTGTCVCTTNTWCDGTGSAPQPCGGDVSSCTGSRCGTSGSCTYSNSCSWDSSTSPPVSTPTPTPTPTAPPPTAPPSYTCTVQGYKVVMPGNQAIAPASSQTVTLNDPVTSTSTQPYFLTYQSASKTRTVSVSVPANYTVGYTLCYNSTTCHTTTPVMSSSVSLPDSSFCGTGNGYADLWWHYYPPPLPNCKNLTGPASLYVGDTGTFTATYEDGAGTIDQRGLGIYREGQCEPDTAAYWNRVNGGPGDQSFNWVPSSAGIYDVDCRAWDVGVSECRGRCYGITPYYAYQCAGPTAARKVTVLTPVIAWWQVKDSDVATNLDLRSTVPAGLMFGKNGDGGYPGVAVYGTSTNLTKTNVSATGWLVNTTYSTSKIYDSNYFVNSIPGDAVINPVSSSSVAGSFFASGGTAYNGYYWYVYDGSAMGGIPLTITNAANLGARKIILIVKGANLSIKGNIKLTKGSGFFLAVAGENAAGSYGNIIVDPGVGGGASANLEGIYVADGTFSSGTGGAKSDSQLWVRGTVAGYGGISLQRDLGSTTNSTTPAEYFEYAPDQELLFPIDLAYSLTTWREVAP